MEQTFIAGALFLATFLSPQTPSIQSSEMPRMEQVREYRVQKGDSILSIAKSEYGSEDYWTTIWNDNDKLENPDLIENGSLLKMRPTTPEEPEELSEKLAKKYGKPKLIATTSVLKQETKTEDKPEQKVETSQPAPTYTGGALNEAQINFLGSCESGMRASTNTGNGFYGAFQFTIGTWNAMGTGYERADMAPIDVQMAAVQSLLSRSSIYSQFPGCAARMRAAGLL